MEEDDDEKKQCRRDQTRSVSFSFSCCDLYAYSRNCIKNNYNRIRNPTTFAYIPWKKFARTILTLLVVEYRFDNISVPSFRTIVFLYLFFVFGFVFRSSLFEHLVIAWRRPELRLFVKGRRDEGIAHTARVHVPNRVGMPLQSFHNGRTGNVPNTNGRFVLAVSIQILTILGPSQFGLAVAVVLVAIQISHLVARSPVHNNVSGGIRRKRQILRVVGRHVHNGKGDMVVETGISGASIQGNLLLGKIVPQIKASQVGRPTGIATQVILSKAQGLYGSRQLKSLNLLEASPRRINEIPFQFVNLNAAIGRGRRKNVFARGPGQTFGVFVVFDGSNFVGNNRSRIGKSIRFQKEDLDGTVHAAGGHKFGSPAVPRKVDGNDGSVAVNRSGSGGRAIVTGIPKRCQGQFLIGTARCQDGIIHGKRTTQYIGNPVAILEKFRFGFGIGSVPGYDKVVSFGHPGIPLVTS